MLQPYAKIVTFTFSLINLHSIPALSRDWVQLRALTGPLKDIHRVVPKPLLRCLGPVLRVIVLLEGEPLAQSEVLSALDQVLIQDISVLRCIQLSLNPDQSPSPCHWKILPPSCFTVGIVLGRWWAVLGFLQTSRLEFRTNGSILVSSDQRILFLTSLKVLKVVFCKLQAVFHASFTEERLPSGHSAMKPRLVECFSDGCPSGNFSHLHKWSLELSQSDHSVLGNLSY